MNTRPLPEVTMDDASRFVDMYIAELCHTLTCISSSGERNYPRGGAYAELQRMLVSIAPRSHRVLANTMIESAAVKSLAESYSASRKRRIDWP